VALPTKGKLYEARTGLGVEEVGDLEMQDEEDLCDLESKLKKVQQKQLKELLDSVHHDSMQKHPSTSTQKRAKQTALGTTGNTPSKTRPRNGSYCFTIEEGVHALRLNPSPK
jgi:hypothetical protein